MNGMAIAKIQSSVPYSNDIRIPKDRVIYGDEDERREVSTVRIPTRSRMYDVTLANVT
jgi:hypothetical protein